MNPNTRQTSAVDRAISWLDERLRERFSSQGSQSDRTKDSTETATINVDWPDNETELTKKQRTISMRLMRINHAGEVAAQALYRGQQRMARNPNIAEHLQKAASEEQQHLDWCKQRLNELDGATSVLDPFWFAGAYAIGATTAALGDDWSLGFVAETERQVVDHLNDHLEKLPNEDNRSRAILERMRDDEAHHGSEALQLGGRELPMPVKLAMRACSKVMTTGAYYL